MEAGEARPPWHRPAPGRHTVTGAPPRHRLGVCAVLSSFATAPARFRTRGHARDHPAAAHWGYPAAAERVGMSSWAPCSSQGAPASPTHEVTSTRGCSSHLLPQKEKQTHRVPAGSAPRCSPSSAAPAQGDGDQHPGVGEQGTSSPPSPVLPSGCPLPALPVPPQPTEARGGGFGPRHCPQLPPVHLSLSAP